MNAGVITDIAQVTPGWLTGVLDHAGLLKRGSCVSDIQVDTSQPFGSMVSRLSVTYSGDVSVRAPRRLFLKIADPKVHQKWPERGQHEVQFYRAIPPGDYLKLPLPRCYDAQVAGEGFHLLLDDLTDTHATLPHPFPPSLNQSRQIIGTLASLHSYHWNSPALDGITNGSSERKTVFEGNEELFPAFADFMGEALWPERRAIFERVIDAAPLLLERLSRGNLTMIHGDAHAWNFLYARETANPTPIAVHRQTVLVDWETWDADVGVFDLAYMIALFWFPAHRARMEKELVRGYHTFLQAGGVHRYSFEDCWNDYRHSVIRLLFKPVWWWHEHRDDNWWAELWWPRLERVLCAFEDLHCEELLG